MKLSIELTAEQVDQIAELVAQKVRGSTGEILTLAQAARKARVSPATLRRWVKAGRLPKVPGSRVIRITSDHLDRVLLLS